MKIQLAVFSYGGLEENTLDSIIYELCHRAEGVEFSYQRISGDALIERSRSRALGHFLSDPGQGDVILMVDHDLSWRPGDAKHVAAEAVNKNALVGGLYSKRGFGVGWSSRVPVSGSVEFGKPGLIETSSVATGFLAIPRKVAEGMVEKLSDEGPIWREAFEKAVDAKDYKAAKSLQDLSISRIVDGAYRLAQYDYYDFFRCIRFPKMDDTGGSQFLSEDWAFCIRANHCGYKTFISTFPVLRHWGTYGYELTDGMDDQDKELLNEKENPKRGPRPHPGARRNSDKLRKRHKA